MPFETLPQMNAHAVGRNSLFHFAISSSVGLRVWYYFHSIIGFLSALFAGIMEASLVQAYSSPFPLSLILPKEQKGRSLFARISRALQGSPILLGTRCRLVPRRRPRSEEHTSELQSQSNLVCRLLL